MAKGKGLLALVVALLVTPLVARASASFYLTHKYEQFVRQHLSAVVPIADLEISRHEVEAVLEPLTAQDFQGALPVIFGEEEAIRQGHAVRYYLVHPALAGCHLYFVFDGLEETSRLVGYRDACE